VDSIDPVFDLSAKKEVIPGINRFFNV